MSRRAALFCTLLTFVIASCGSDSSGPSGGGAGLSARIDGAQWQAGTLGFTVQTTSQPGGFYIQGSSTTGGTATSLNLMLSRITGPGSYPLGVNYSNSGGIATVTRGAQGYSTPLSGAAGTVSITSITAARIAGTFSFQADPIVAGAGAAIAVTSGEFDVALPAGFTVAGADQAGSLVSGSIGGVAWNGATIVATGGTTLNFVAGNTTHMVSFIGQIPGPGTYPLNATFPSRRITVQAIPGGEGWSGSAAGDGSITVTTYTATRAVGTFTGTLPRVGATGAALTVSGTFNLRFEQP
jgi:hypothetical protein